jgi:hypothetical protein
MEEEFISEEVKWAFNLDELFSYVYHSDKYRLKLEKSITSELWEYSTVLVWKTIILFMYENLFQMKKSEKDLPKDLSGQLKVNNITCYSCFDFTCLKDDSLYTNLNKIYENVENFYKELFKSQLNKRNGLSHVNKYEEDFNKSWFETYFDESLKLLKYLQELHNQQIIKEMPEKIIGREFNEILSEKDVYYLLDISGVLESNPEIFKSKVIKVILEKKYHKRLSEDLRTQIKEAVIGSLSDSYCFESAETNCNLLLKLSDEFDKFDIKKIIEILIKDLEYTNSQIFGARGMQGIILELFELSRNIEETEKDWKSLLDSIKKSSYKSRLNNLIQKLEDFE